MLSNTTGHCAAKNRCILDDIPGIGPSRRKALMKKYQSLEAIREASAEDLADTESMNEKAAQAVYEFLHKDAVL